MPVRRAGLPRRESPTPEGTNERSRHDTEMAYRIEVERALDEMISDETGNRFQGLAVIHAQQKWPQLIACERKWDSGARCASKRRAAT